MLRSTGAFAIVAAIALAMAACSPTRITASGAKHKPIYNFSFLVNNNQSNSAEIYQRYLAKNEKFISQGHKPGKRPAAKKKPAEQKSGTLKRFLAMN